MSDHFGINILIAPKQPATGRSFMAATLDASLPNTPSAQVVADSIAAVLQEQYGHGLTEWDRLDLSIDIAVLVKREGSMWTVTDTAKLDAAVSTSASTHEVRAAVVATLQGQYGSGFAERDLNLWLD